MDKNATRVQKFTWHISNDYESNPPRRYQCKMQCLSQRHHNIWKIEAVHDDNLKIILAKLEKKNLKINSNISRSQTSGINH